MRRQVCQGLVGLIVAFAVGQGCGEEPPVEIDGWRLVGLPEEIVRPFQPVDLEFEIQENCSGAQVILTGFEDAPIQVVAITTPNGDSGFPPSSLFSDSGSRTLVIPLHPGQAGVPAGTWRITIQGNEEAPVRGWIAERVLPVSDRPRIRLQFIGVHRGWSSAEALERALTPALQECRAILGPPSKLSIDLEGVVRVTNPEALNEWSVIEGVGGASNEMDNLFAWVPTPERVIPLFFVEEIVRTDGKGIVSMWSPSVPGPAFKGTFHKSGLLIRIPSEGEPMPADLGVRMAHTVGHFLGLPHTTEANGADLLAPPFGETGTDGLESTPVCPDERDEDQDGFLVWTECEEEDGLNVMFWSPQPFSQVLTAEQGEILLHHPCVE